MNTPALVPLKHWVINEAQRCSCAIQTVYDRIYRGRYPHLRRHTVNASVVFVPNEQSPYEPGNPGRKAYPKQLVDAATKLAAETSDENAARKYGVSVSSVRNWRKAAGIPGRRRGNYTLAEAEAMGSKLRF